MALHIAIEQSHQLLATRSFEIRTQSKQWHFVYCRIHYIQLAYTKIPHIIKKMGKSSAWIRLQFYRIYRDHRLNVIILCSKILFVCCNCNFKKLNYKSQHSFIHSLGWRFPMWMKHFLRSKNNWKTCIHPSIAMNKSANTNTDNNNSSKCTDPHKWAMTLPISMSPYTRHTNWLMFIGMLCVLIAYFLHLAIFALTLPSFFLRLIALSVLLLLFS